MTWSQEEALNQRKNALRLLLQENSGQFARSTDGYQQSNSDIPAGVWSLLYQERLIDGNEPGGPSWCLTVTGWIEACRLLRDEVGLDKQFCLLSAHLKDLVKGRSGAVYTTTDEIAKNTGLGERWVLDALQGGLAESVYCQHGAKLEDAAGYVEIPAHFGNKLSSG